MCHSVISAHAESASPYFMTKSLQNIAQSEATGTGQPLHAFRNHQMPQLASASSDNCLGEETSAARSVSAVG
jgi:hypothetical protein